MERVRPARAGVCEERRRFSAGHGGRIVPAAGRPPACAAGCRAGHRRPARAGARGRPRELFPLHTERRGVHDGPRLGHRGGTAAPSATSTAEAAVRRPAARSASSRLPRAGGRRPSGRSRAARPRPPPPAPRRRCRAPPPLPRRHRHRRRSARRRARPRRCCRRTGRRGPRQRVDRADELRLGRAVITTSVTTACAAPSRWRPRPRRPRAASRPRRGRRAARQGQVDQVEAGARNAALWITGDSECATGQPSNATGRVVAVGHAPPGDRLASSAVVLAAAPSRKRATLTLCSSSVSANRWVPSHSGART